MLSGISRFLLPRMASTTRSMCAVRLENQGKDKWQDKELENVQAVEDQMFGNYFGTTDNEDIRRTGKGQFRKHKKFTKTSVRKPPVIKDPVPNPWGVVNLALHDPLFSKLIMDARIPRRMKKQQKMVVEGRRLIQDALRVHLKPSALFVTDTELLEDLSEYESDIIGKCPIYKVSAKDLGTWSSLTTPPGIMGIFERPSESSPPQNCLPLTVICDNIREPNNLGSIFRVCAALPCAQVLVMKGCADPWEAKCLRGGSGGQFHIPIEYPMLWEDLCTAVDPKKTEIFLADTAAHGERLKLNLRTIDDPLVTESSSGKNIFLVIGGETHGISNEAVKFVQSLGGGSVVNIPTALAVDSLNTASALAIILYEFRRQILSLSKE